MNTYQERITAAIVGTKWAAAAPQIVECWMRLEHGTLDGLDPRQFDACARNYARMTVEYPQESRGLAESYGVSIGGAS